MSDIAAGSREDQESTYRRMKRQRDDARAAFQQQQQTIDQLRESQARMEARLDQVLSGTGTKESDSMSLSDLRKVATDPNFVPENPAAANEAMIQYMTGMVQSLEKKIEESTSGLGDTLAKNIETNVFGKLQLQEQERQVWQQIERDFGTIARDPESDLYQEADSLYRQITAAHAARNGQDAPIPADYKRLAFLEAEKRLQQQGGLKDSTPPEAPKGSPGPPPGSQVETTGEGTADAAAKRDQLLAEGDWKGSLAEKARAMYPEE